MFWLFNGSQHVCWDLVFWQITFWILYFEHRVHCSIVPFGKNMKGSTVWYECRIWLMYNTTMHSCWFPNLDLVSSLLHCIIFCTNNNNNTSNIFSEMEINTLESILEIKFMDSAFITLLMAIVMRVLGMKAVSKATVCILSEAATQDAANGTVAISRPPFLH